MPAAMTKKKFRPGDVICKEGEAGGTLYLIESGSLTVEKKAFEGEAASKVVARLGPGEFFGEMAFLQGLPHSATVIAQTEASLMLLSRSTLDDLIGKDPSAAVNEVLNVAMGLSGRLRATTRELVTVYEIARAVADATDMDGLARQTLGQLQLDLGEGRSVAFYRWNMFNDEYALISARGADEGRFPAVIASSVGNLPFQAGQFVLSRIVRAGKPLGLLVYTSAKKDSFDAGERQMMETVAAVLSSAMASAFQREEDEARRRLERNKQTGASL